MMPNPDNQQNLPLSTDLDQLVTWLPIRSGDRLLELGFGRAETTRLLAERFPGLEIIATEVDPIQLANCQAIDDLRNVSFRAGGAQQIDLPDASVNYVVMLKSLHHVPPEWMDQSLTEIARVLRPGGLAYLSEPVYAGPLNQIIKRFHDERQVRQDAYQAIQRAVRSDRFEQTMERFFLMETRFRGFEEFESRILRATHHQFTIDSDMVQKVRQAFEVHLNPATGIATFQAPIRINLLRRTQP